MLWCDLCLTPLEPNGYSVAGLSQTLRTLNFGRGLNPGLRTHVIINRHIRRSKRQRPYIEQIAERVHLTKPFLSLHVAVADALDSGQPVWRYKRAAETFATQPPKRRVRRSLPDLRSLRTVRQLCEEYPHLFSEGSLRWLIFQRQTNGFDRCVLHVGKRLYIDVDALRQWLAEHRGSRFEGRAIGVSPRAGSPGR